MEITIYKSNEIEFKETADPSKGISRAMADYIESHDNDEVEAMTIGFVKGVKQKDIHDLAIIKPDKIERLVVFLS